MLETPRLRIIPCDDSLFDAIRMGNKVLSQVIAANVPKKWSAVHDTFGPAYLRWKAHPPLRDWWMHLIVYVPDNLLIGTCGYKGEPDAEGRVEIGYEIRPSHQQMGLATEVASALVAHAFSQEEVRKVIAHTLPHPSASTSVLQKVGFMRVEDFQHEEEGWLWRWECVKGKM